MKSMFEASSIQLSVKEYGIAITSFSTSPVYSKNVSKFVNPITSFLCRETQAPSRS